MIKESFNEGANEGDQILSWHLDGELWDHIDYNIITLKLSVKITQPPDFSILYLLQNVVFRVP